MKLNKFIKLLIVPLLMLNLMFSNKVDISAASFSVGKSTSSVKAGGTFNVNIKASGEGKFNISVSNGSTSTKSLWVTGSASVSVKAGQSGTTTVTVTAVDATGYDETPITGSKSVSVSIQKPTSSNNNKPSSDNKPSSGNKPSSNTGTQKPVVDTRSKDNNLSSLSVSQGQLSPTFSASKTSYKVELTSDIKEINVSAKAKDSKSKVSGTGKHELKIGENNITVSVVAENGSKKTYTISVIVVEKPEVFIKMGEQNLGVLNDYSKVDTPKGYEKTSIKIEDKEVNALKNEVNGLTLLYMQDENNKNSFYVYDNGSVYLYQTISIYGNQYIIVKSPDNLMEISQMEQVKVKIGEIELDGWKYKEEELTNYRIVYLMNSEGKAHLYSYESTEGTLQLYTPVVTNDDSLNTMTYVFMGTTGVFAMTSIVGFVMYFRFKKKSISAIKDYYERKNQG